MKKLALAFALSLAATIGTNAAIVANFDFTSGNNSSDTEAFSTATPIAAVGFTPTINASNGNPFPSTEFRLADIVDGTNPPGPAPTNASTDYYTFTITPTGGTMLTFNTLTFDARSLDLSLNANAFSVSLQVGQNTFASNIGTAVINNNTTFQNFSFDLSGLAPTTAAIEFRLVIRDNSGSASRGGLLDNIVVNSDVAPIPEPATYMLLGCGVLMCVQQFRRKQSRS